MQRILHAIQFATEAHKQQKRIALETPYISHPLAVALLVSKIGADEDTIIAAILHDTIEDTQITYTDIKKIFGTDVADTVQHHTEDDITIPWEKRKQKAREHIAVMP